MAWGFIVSPSLIEERPLLLAVPFRPLLLVPVLLAVLALDLLPINQFKRRRHHAHKARPLDRLETLAAARGHLVLRRPELHRLAARRFEDKLVEAPAHQRPAQ